MRETPENLNTQAIELAQKGDYTEAIACFKRALSIERYNYLLWYNLGVTYRDCGDLQAAKHALEKAYAIQDDDDSVIETLALVCYHMDDIEAALAYCAEGIETNQNNAHLWNTIGVIYFNRSEYDLACEAFEHAVTISPYYYDALFNLRDTYEELGNATGVAMCQQQMNQVRGESNSHA